MFQRFFSFDPKGSKANAPAPTIDDLNQPSHDRNDTVSVAQPPKRRRRDSSHDHDANSPAPKRSRVNDLMQEQISEAQSNIDVRAKASENIEMAFLSQISLKHMELESINKEIGKCQAALEQLRRCHLIPYPVNAPTPAQMLDVVQGKGHALQQPGQPVPRYAPPFGVVDGPYARHYAKWLIPHPHFDGVQYEERGALHAQYAWGVEGRSTRNSGVEGSKHVRGRASRGEPMPAFQSLTAEKPQPKAKAGPCLIKRSDGVTVKLQCVDCERDNFNSVQGFINHCRIAHKREFKSHEEAATKSGQPWDSAEEAAGAGQEPVLPKTSRSIPKETPKAPPATVAANVLTGTQMSNSEACASLVSRIESVMSLWEQSQRATHKETKTSTKSEVEAETPAAFEGSLETPHLSKLMRSRKFAGSLADIVKEAKTPLLFEDITPDEESEDEISSAGKDIERDGPAVVKRLPAGASKSPMMSAARPASSKGVTPSRSRAPAPRTRLDQDMVSDEDVEVEEPTLSPNTLIPNSAPSLVSDDGEYDDSEDASSVSGHSEGLDAESVSDVADINIEEEHEPRNLRRTSTGVSNAVRLRREDPKHVSIVSPVPKSRTKRSKRKA